MVNWDEQPLQRWLNTISKAGTKYQYRSAFRTYIQYTGLTATQLIDEALEDVKQDPRNRKDVVLQRLIGFYNWLKTDYEVKSRGKGEHKILRKGVSDKFALTNVNAVRSFYSTYDVVVRLKGRHALPKAKVLNKRMKVGAEQVKTLVDHARTPRDRAIILTMFQGGMDVSTLCSLSYGDIAKALHKKMYPLRLNLHRPKSGVEYYTFLGSDAVKALKAYIRDAESRGVEFTGNMSLFVTERGKQPLNTHNVQTMLRDVAIKSGLVNENNNGKAFNPLSPHALRESFGSIMINSGVPDTIVDFWLGHSIGEMAEAYKGLQYKSLKKMYLDREKLLNISQSTIDLEEVKRKVRDEIEEHDKQLQTLVNGLATDNLRLKNEFEEMKKEYIKTKQDNSEIKGEIKMVRQRMDHFLELMDLDSEEDLHDLSEIIQDWRERKKIKEEAEAFEDEQKERAEILKKLKKDEKT